MARHLAVVRRGGRGDCRQHLPGRRRRLARRDGRRAGRRVRRAHGGQLDLADHALHRQRVGRVRPRRGVLHFAHPPRPGRHDRARVRGGVGGGPGHQEAAVRQVALQRGPGGHIGRCGHPRLRAAARAEHAHRLRQGGCRPGRGGVLLHRQHRRHGDHPVDPGHAVAAHRGGRHRRQAPRHLRQRRHRHPDGAAPGARSQVPPPGRAAPGHPARRRCGSLLRAARPGPVAWAVRGHARRQPGQEHRRDEDGGAARRQLVAALARGDPHVRPAGRART